MVAQHPARAHLLPDRSVELTFRYDQGFIEVLKQNIPARERRYLPETHSWWVSAAFMTRAIDLLHAWFGTIEFDREPREQGHWQTSPAPPADPFRQLYLRPEAPLPVVELVYRHLSKMVHPDTRPAAEHALAHREMVALNGAYEEIRRKLGAA